MASLRPWVAALLATLVGAILVVSTLLITDSKDSVQTSAVTTTTLPSVLDAKRDIVQVTSTFSAGANTPNASSIVLVGDIPTVASGPYPDYKTNISAGPTAIWEYRDNQWSKVFEAAVGQETGRFSFTDLNGDGIDEIVVNGKSVMMRIDGSWRNIPFVSTGQANNGVIDLDKDLRVTTNSSNCSRPPCSAPTVQHWRYDDATRSFVLA